MLHCEFSWLARHLLIDVRIARASAPFVEGIAGSVSDAARRRGFARFVTGDALLSPYTWPVASATGHFFAGLAVMQHVALRAFLPRRIMRLGMSLA
ncbi:hypothetical protein DKG75_22220 [Zavarzinia compransoris]|uniref:Uncharacterized protein n=1 Tax=Zavarzinia compransoris TaxID=1264899 RepID=A0A317DT41_9PROT|nr:hypothetical protein DKG75_22220 [Zavarzinia compransoris]